jgi:hypothetical protein
MCRVCFKCESGRWRVYYTPLYSSCQEAPPAPKSSSRSLILLISRTTLQETSRQTRLSWMEPTERTSSLVVSSVVWFSHATPAIISILFSYSSVSVKWLRSRCLRFTITQTAVGDRRRPTSLRRSSSRIFHTLHIQSQINLVDSPTGMISLEIIDRPYLTLLPIPEPALAVVGMPCKPSGVAFQARFLSRLRMNRASPLWITRLVHPVEVVRLGGEGALTAVLLLTTRVVLRGVAVGVSRTIVVGRNGAGGEDGATGTR